MKLFIPTSTTGESDFANMPLVKGQLYNIDLDEFLTFQFNPQNFEWAHELNWGNINWKGNFNGGFSDFINRQPNKFELALLFIADPGSPDVAYNVKEKISNSSVSMDFEEIEKMITRWESKIEGLNRPSRIRVIFGPRYFDVVPVGIKYQILYFFEDLTVREGIITLGCKEWNQN